MADWINEVRFDKQGLIPVIAQDYTTGRVLMVAWMNAQAVQLTAERGEAIYYSRSRQQLWHKGETSGHTQKVHEVRLDCDSDVIILQVEQIGGIACHTGRESCFYKKLTPDGWQTVDAVLKDPKEIYSSIPKPTNSASSIQPVDLDAQTVDLNSNLVEQLSSNQILEQLGNIILARKQSSADSSYVASLYEKGLNKILEKVGEETTETLIAAKDAQLDHTLLDDLIYETADLWFHTIVMLGYYNLTPTSVLNELGRRFGLSGITEKAQRSQ